MKVFKNNEFFAGLSIPEPDVRESLEAKMPRDFSADGMDFLKVWYVQKSQIYQGVLISIDAALLTECSPTFGQLSTCLRPLRQSE